MKLNNMTLAGQGIAQPEYSMGDISGNDFAAIDAGNLLPVAQVMRDNHPQKHNCLHVRNWDVIPVVFVVSF